ncbi:MAG: hypothetical protein U5P10_08850 [Spirochaetia bacterium]|nr:hypothetical protein [Spirochaetia bacterium]
MIGSGDIADLEEELTSQQRPLAEEAEPLQFREETFIHYQRIRIKAGA